MSEQKVPTLSLSSDAAAQQKIEETIESLQVPVAPSADNAVKAALDEQFSVEEKAEIARFAGTIDITNPDHVMLYGADAQKKISDFSDTVLNTVKNKDAGEVGDMLTKLIVELKGFDSSLEKPKGLRGLFFNARAQLATVKTKYDAISTNVETISSALQDHQVQLLKDVAMFNRLYEMNLTYFRELSMYIAAGEMRLQSVRENELAKLRAKAAETNDPMDAQAAKDLADQCDRFEKKLYDLKLSRTVSLQTAPQIRLLQNNNALLVERIQSTLVNTLPLWKNQMVLAIGMQHSQEAMKAQRAVTDTTNELLKKNAEALKMGTLETAKEAERGIIDIETLTKTNQDLIDTITEVQRIQQEGREKRAAAEKKLQEMEDQLKKKILEQ